MLKYDRKYNIYTTFNKANDNLKLYLVVLIYLSQLLVCYLCITADGVLAKKLIRQDDSSQDTLKLCIF